MAHCNSSLVHTPSYAAHMGAHDGKFQDLLPPRKRLLAGLKHVKANAAISGSLMSTPPQSRLGVACIETTTTSPSPLPPCSLLLHSPTHKCFSCGDGRVLLHRVPRLAGSTSYLCSSCVLLSNKKLYCVLCFQIIKEGLLTPSSTSSPSFLTCCRCQRLTHLDCALKIWSPSLEGAGLTLCKDCYTRNNGQQSREPPTKKQKMASVRRSKQAVVSACKVKLPVVDKQALTAAKIVAIAAKREAFEAKQRATVLAKAAARAAAHAKAALDSVYEISQRKADKEEDAGVVDIESKDEVSVTTAKTSRCLKRRALSAIVASETLSRDLTTGNRMAKIEKLKRQRCTSSDAYNGECMPSNEAAVEATSRRPMQNAKLGIKRRKTLSSLTNMHAVANSKGSKSSKKSIGSSSSTKGKLGAIVSQVLALSKISKTSKAAEKGNGLGVCCATLDDGVIDEIQENACRTLTGSNVCLPSSGLIASIDACKPSYNGDVTSCEERIQSSKSFKEWMQCTEAMRTDGWGMIQEQLVKGRFVGGEAVGSQQERKLLNCLTKTMPARKSMYANGVTTVRGTLKR